MAKVGAQSIYVWRRGLSPARELMNVVICRDRVFDFSKPLQGTRPTLIGWRSDARLPAGAAWRTGRAERKNRVLLLYVTEKGFGGSEKNHEWNDARAHTEIERETDKNPFCWLRNKTDRVILRHFWQN